MFAFLLKAFEYIAPLTTLTYMGGWLTDAKMGGFTQWLIKKFVKTYKIQLDECAEPDLSKYQTFNDFFVRPLKPEARPINQRCWGICPVDGTVGQAGNIEGGRLIQAKGIDYSLRGLLGGNDVDWRAFDKGHFCCIYLSPANYHRIHMPMDGILLRTIHIPGKHFPVGRRNVSYMPDLFTKNERLVCIFETAVGPFALIMVAAAMVGSIVTSWDGRIVRRKDVLEKDFDGPEKRQFRRGDELGMFKFGSTVICLWPKNTVELNELMVSGQTVKMGQAMIGNYNEFVPPFLPPIEEEQAKEDQAQVEPSANDPADAQANVSEGAGVKIIDLEQGVNPAGEPQVSGAATVDIAHLTEPKAQSAEAVAEANDKAASKDASQSDKADVAESAKTEVAQADQAEKADQAKAGAGNEAKVKVEAKTESEANVKTDLEA